jgi:hypothetical protein
VSESAVSAKTGLGLVWRETGAGRNARPSRGQAAGRPEEDGVGKDAVGFLFSVARELRTEAL